jgi:aminoglycoside 3-N-acetyltransferase
MKNTGTAGVTLFFTEDRVFTQKDILEALQKTGVHQGDVVYVHADLTAFGKLAAGVGRADFLDAFVTALEGAVGENGTVIMPTFTYSFCNHAVYDPEKTPSTVGVLSEYFRTMAGTLRSTDALFSSAARGKEAAYFTTVGTDCFGSGSVFEKLYIRNAKLVFLGPRFDITYMHFVEQRLGVPYRFSKHFTGHIKTQNELTEATFAYYVRPLDEHVEYDLEGIAKNFDRAGILCTAALGSSVVRIVGARDAFETIKAGIAHNARYLLQS